MSQEISGDFEGDGVSDICLTAGCKGSDSLRSRDEVPCGKCHRDRRA